MAIQANAFVLQNNTYQAITFRQSSSNPFRSAGVISSTDFVTTVGSGMQVNVSAGRAKVAGTEATAPSGQSWTTQGMYDVLNDASVSLTIATSNPSQPRIDVVYVGVQDAAYSGSSNTAVLAVATGTPAASPVAPSVPVDCIALAQVNVAAGASTVTVTDVRSFAKLIANVQYVADLTALAALTGMVSGDEAWVGSLSVSFAYTGTKWVQQGPSTFASAATRNTEYAKAAGAYLVAGAQVWRTDTNSMETFSSNTSYILGTTAGTSSSTGWWSTFKPNAAINADLYFNQRNFSSLTTSGYGFDRHFFLTDGVGATHTPQTFTPGTAPVAGQYEAQNWAQIVTTGQSAVTTQTVWGQKIEDVRSFAGQTITVSWWGYSGTAGLKVAVELDQMFGSGGSPSADVYSYAGTVTTVSGWSKYAVTFTVPSISGKTIGSTANSSFLGIDFWVSAGSNFASRTNTLGIQSGTFGFFGLKVEKNPSPSEYSTSQPTRPAELNSCQRYYWRQTAGANTMITAFGQVLSTVLAGFAIPMKTTMRAVPTADFSAASLFSASGSSGGSTAAATSVTMPANTTNEVAYINLNWGSAQAITAGNATALQINPTGYVGFAAEL